MWKTKKEFEEDVNLEFNQPKLPENFELFLKLFFPGNNTTIFQAWTKFKRAYALKNIFRIKIESFYKLCMKDAIKELA